MKTSRQFMRCWPGAAALGAVLAVAAVAQGETAKLELKRLDAPKQPGMYSGDDAMLRYTSAQHFFVHRQKGPDGKEMVHEDESKKEAFQRIVKKEPTYASENPFRSVAQLGSKEYAFALDFVPPKSESAKDESKADDGKSKPKDEAADNELEKTESKDAKTDSAKAKQPKAANYNRVYFDFNGNGDLTDDPVVEADTGIDKPRALGVGNSYGRFSFPRVDIALDVDGTSFDYSLFISGNSHASSDYSYVSLQINAAAYREGSITLDEKKHRVVVLDFNSNGRFDDETKVQEVFYGPNDKRLHSQSGDMLLIDVDSNKPRKGLPYDFTSNDYQQYVSKLVNIDGRFYDLKISPTGDELTLTPSSTPLGHVTNSSGSFTAAIYGDQGILKLHGKKDTSIPVPEGEWRLLSYTLDRSEMSMDGEKAVEPKAGSWLEALAQQVESALGGRPSTAGRSRPSLVSATGTGEGKAIKVVKDETVVLPFGPPYKPKVTSRFMGPPQAGDDKHPRQMSLQLSLIGVAGEVCTNMTANGSRPSKPHFTITDSQGEVVQQGDFEYG